MTIHENEKWLANAFRPSAMVWTLRTLYHSPRSQIELLRAAQSVNISAAAVRHALQVAEVHGLVDQQRVRQVGRKYVLRLRPLGEALLEMPISKWDTAIIRVPDDARHRDMFP